MEYSSSRRKHFTQEKKQLIINEHYSSGISIPVLARKHGVHAITLYSWKRQMNQKKMNLQLFWRNNIWHMRCNPLKALL